MLTRTSFEEDIVLHQEISGSEHIFATIHPIGDMMQSALETQEIRV